MLLFGLHQLVERFMFRTATLFDVFHEMYQFNEDGDCKIFNFINTFEKMNLNAVFVKIVLIEFILKKAKSVQE
jgi:hypothetical protein